MRLSAQTRTSDIGFRIKMMILVAACAEIVQKSHKRCHGLPTGNGLFMDRHQSESVNSDESVNDVNSMEVSLTLKGEYKHFD